MRFLVGAALLAFTIGVAPALAQTSAASPGADEKKAISKGLHGKARKKFRSACKHAGGKVQ